MLPHVLRLAIDTIEVTFTGELDDEMHGVLELAKLEAQGTNTPVPLRLGGMEFFVQSKGLEGYAYRVENHLLLLRVTVSEYRPLVWAKFTAYGLALHGPKALLKLLRAALADLGKVEESNLSRVDVACDVQRFEVTEDDMRNVVFKGRYRNFHQDGAGWTYQFGKGDVVVRVYDKTEEIRAKRRYWVERELAGCLGYDDSRHVQRIEVQLRGAVLNDVRLPTVESCFDRVAAIFDFGMRWAELRVPLGDDQTVTRWPLDPRWEHIRESCRPTKPLRHHPYKPHLEDRERAVKRLLGALSTIGTYDDSDDLVKTASAVVAELLAQVEKGELDYPLLVEQKRRRLGVTHNEEEPF